MLGHNPVGRTDSYNEPLVVPAGYAFSIWGLIYTGLIVFPIYQLIKRKERHELWKKVRIWFSLNVVANGLWLVFASYDWLWTTVLVILFLLVSLFKINELLIRIKSEGEKVNFWTERLVFSLYYAWITLATALNISAALNYYQWDGFNISDITWSLIVLTVTAVIAGLVFWKYRDTVFAGVVIWAFFALVVKHIEQHPTLAYFSIVVIVAFLVLMLVRRRRRPLIGA